VCNRLKLLGVLFIGVYGPEPHFELVILTDKDFFCHLNPRC
jgi:hypothetical protein